jgi:hypothetical protein
MLTFARLLVATGLCAAICSCLTNYPVLQVTTGGSVQRGVLFNLSDLYHDHPAGFEVTHVEVMELQKNDSTVIWDVRGHETLRSLIYGRRYPGLTPVDYPGLKLIQPTGNLQRNRTYTVTVDISTGGTAEAAFRVDDSGAVRQIDWGRAMLRQ